ncbi:hypothetical protein M885DRAFT_532628, partial [Pelagophyceae sp. CCMP2097]
SLGGPFSRRALGGSSATVPRAVPWAVARLPSPRLWPLCVPLGGPSDAPSDGRLGGSFGRCLWAVPETGPPRPLFDCGPECDVPWADPGRLDGPSQTVWHFFSSKGPRKARLWRHARGLDRALAREITDGHVCQAQGALGVIPNPRSRRGCKPKSVRCSDLPLFFDGPPETTPRDTRKASGRRFEKAPRNDGHSKKPLETGAIRGRHSRAPCRQSLSTMLLDGPGGGHSPRRIETAPRGAISKCL